MFSGVYQTGKLEAAASGARCSAIGPSLRSWKFLPGRPFNIITGSGDNLQLSSLTGRPNTTVDPACGTVYHVEVFADAENCRSLAFTASSKAGVAPTLLQLDGNSRPQCRDHALDRLQRYERLEAHLLQRAIQHADLIVDMFNIANRNNMAAVSPLFSNAGQADRGLRSAPVPVRDEDELVSFLFSVISRRAFAAERFLWFGGGVDVERYTDLRFARRHEPPVTHARSHLAQAAQQASLTATAN